MRRHAGAGHVRLGVSTVDGISVEIADDGAGFDNALLRGTPGFGLSGMRHRVEEVGGLLAVDTRPGAGTRVTASLP